MVKLSQFDCKGSHNLRTSSQSSVDAIVHNRRANNRAARTVRSAGLLGLLAQTAGTARPARISGLVEN